MVENNRNCIEKGKLTSTGGDVEEFGNINFPPIYSFS